MARVPMGTYRTGHGVGAQELPGLGVVEAVAKDACSEVAVPFVAAVEEFHRAAALVVFQLAKGAKGVAAHHVARIVQEHLRGAHGVAYHVGELPGARAVLLGLGDGV